MVYGIIKQHEGWITIYSEPGHGSTFAIYLPAFPIKLEYEEKETISLKELKEFKGKGERILLVEDEESVRAFISKILDKNGYTVIQAADVKEALDIFKQEQGNFDLTISDVVLPDHTGLELVEQLLLARSDLHILLISGYPDQKSQWATIRRRGFRFIQKPFTLADLLRSVRELAGHN